MQKKALFIVLFFAMVFTGCASKKPADVESKTNVADKAYSFFLVLSAEIKNARWGNVWDLLSEKSKDSFVSEMNLLRKDLSEIPNEERRANIPGLAVSYDYVIQLDDKSLFTFLMTNRNINIGVLGVLHNDFEQIASGGLNRGTVKPDSAEIVPKNGKIRKIVFENGKWHLEYLLTGDKAE